MTVLCNPLDLQPMYSRAELEKLAIFAVCVAGKSARIVWPKIQNMLSTTHNIWPFAWLQKWTRDGSLEERLKFNKMGQYRRILPALQKMGELAEGWEWHHLLDVPGIKLKTAKLVQLYTWPGQECACLDRHVLRDMKTWSVVKKLGIKVPDSAPQDRDIYIVLEEIFKLEALRRLKACWVLDKEIWLKYAKKEKVAA